LLIMSFIIPSQSSLCLLKNKPIFCKSLESYHFLGKI
jgi:hypothetical protein